jgi:hypothetical protein
MRDPLGGMISRWYQGVKKRMYRSGAWYNSGYRHVQVAGWCYGATLFEKNYDVNNGPRSDFCCAEGKTTVDWWCYITAKSKLKNVTFAPNRRTIFRFQIPDLRIYEYFAVM